MPDTQSELDALYARLERIERSFRVELDKPNNIVLAIVTEDDDSEHDYQFDFDSRTGRWEFAERDLLERDFGEDWVEEFEELIPFLVQLKPSSKPGEGFFINFHLAIWFTI